MDKRQALKVLIEHSFLFPEEVKNKLLNKVETFTDEQVEELGKFLAMEKKKSLESAQDNINHIDQFLENLDTLSDEEFADIMNSSENQTTKSQ